MRFSKVLKGTLRSIFLSTALLACSTTSVKPAAHDPSSFNTVPFNVDQNSAPGCLSMMNQYCNSLYHPDHSGNMVIPTKDTPIYIRQGKTSNDLNQVYYELAMSKIRNQKNLPHDFGSILHAHQYFSKLEEFIHRKPLEFMNLMDRMETMEQQAEIETLWYLAINETLLQRTTNQFPSFPKIPDDLIPPEISHFRSQEKRILLSEISRAIWANNPNWNKVKNTFESLRKVYLQVIQTLAITPDLKADWSDRIKTMKIVPPGSLPELTDQDCASTTVNAYYYSHFNTLTICAGDFNGEDSLQTLGHEMSHALDIDRSLYLFFKKSKTSKTIENLGKNWCSNDSNKISCSDWSHFKESLSSNLTELSQYAPDVPEFNRCLKRNSTLPLNPELIHRFATQATQSSIRDLADEEAFLRITQAKLPMTNGKNMKNPSFMNPCSYLKADWNTEALDSELSMLTVFLTEYQCSAETTNLAKLRSAITTTQNIFNDIENAIITSEGEFSERREMMDEKYSSSPAERFADVMGSYVVAQYMKNLQSLWDRRALFLASNSWQCSAPSLSKNFPVESLMLRQYVQDAHTDGDDRKKEILSTPIRDALGCKMDFSWNECSISLFPK